MSIAANLYPPLIADSQAAFVRTNTCKIYFSLSAYNSRDSIANVQVSLINQKTNISALKTSIYPSGIKIAKLKQDSSIGNNYKYYIEIEPSDLTNEIFELNQFYKVQLRFTSTSAAAVPSTGTKLATWLTENIAYFSEWSTVCLIKGIDQPQISIHNFSEDSFIALATPIVDIIGKMYFDDINEKEYLKNYQVLLYQDDSLLIDSGEVCTNQFNPNEFNYELGIQLIPATKYSMQLIFTTINGYTETKVYNFSILESEIDKLNVGISATTENQNGRIKIQIISTDSVNFSGNLTIRRTSSESDFHKWEDVKNFVFKTNQPLNFAWYDYTVESGIWYKYCIQKRDLNGGRGVITSTEVPVMCEFEDIFLVRQGCQLKIQFNPSLNEFKYNVTESQQTTLGAKFPFIRRNGNNYFKSFPIGGLISSFVDATNWYDPHYYDNGFHEDENEIQIFSSKKEIYGKHLDLYNEYNSQNNISDYQDRIYERKFREKVYKFLYEHNAKLFKSTTEGNILVKLMNIDFQPIESLGRRLYSFTATAIEVDEPTISNYNLYGIQTIGEIESQTESTSTIYETEVLGQIYGHCSTDELLSTTLKNKYQGRAPSGYSASVKKLTWLRIEVYSDPYFIAEENGELVKATSTGTPFYGHIVIINGVQMILKSNTIRRALDATDTTAPRTIDSIGYFELDEEDTEITSLRFKYEEDAVIDFIAILENTLTTSSIKRVEYYNTWGQLYKSFEPEESIMQQIAKKYYFDYSNYVQKLNDVSHIRIQGPVGAVVYIKDSKDSNFNKHILETGYLELQDNEVFIEGIYFCGVHLKQHNNPTSAIRDDEYYIIPSYYDSLEEIDNPIANGVYKLSYLVVDEDIESFDAQENLLTVDPSDVQQETDLNYSLFLTRIKEDSDKYIYYHGNWYPFTNDNDVLVSVDGIIDYYGEIIRTVYVE